MANHVLRQLRDQVQAALQVNGILSTVSAAHVFINRSEEQALQDAELPAIRIYVRDSDASIGSMGVNRVYERTAKIRIDCCVKKNATFEDDVFTICKEVEIGLNDAVVSAKKIDIERIEIQDDAQGEKPVCVAQMTFDCLFYTRVGVPDAFL